MNLTTPGAPYGFKAGSKHTARSLLSSDRELSFFFQIAAQNAANVLNCARGASIVPAAPQSSIALASLLPNLQLSIPLLL